MYILPAYHSDREYKWGLLTNMTLIGDKIVSYGLYLLYPTIPIGIHSFLYRIKLSRDFIFRTSQPVGLISPYGLQAYALEPCLPAGFQGLEDPVYEMHRPDQVFVALWHDASPQHIQKMLHFISIDH